MDGLRIRETRGLQVRCWLCCVASLAWLGCSSESQGPSAIAGNSGTSASPPAGASPASDAAGAPAIQPIAGARAGTSLPSAPAAGGGGGNSSLPPPAAGASAGAAGGATAGAAAGTSADAGVSPSDASAIDPTATGPALPAIDDPGATGPFEIEVVETLDGLSTHGLIAPKDLGRDGIKHPIVVWINGASTGFSSYRNMLDNVAAHGFFLLDDKQSSFDSAPEVEAQLAAIDWAVAQNELQGGPYFGKLDEARIAIAGHSLGSVSTFGNLKDPRIKTSIHMAGGLTGNPEGVDESWLQDLHAPAAFFSGSADQGLTRVMNDFTAAPPMVPLFLGVLAGVGHLDEFTEPNGGRWGRAMIAWLRWQLADDPAFEKSFVGADCEFCMGDWSAMKHVLD